MSVGGAGRAAFFHRKPGGWGPVEEQKYFRAQKRQAVREGKGKCPFCEMSGVVPPCRPPGRHGTRQPAGLARARARSMPPTQRRAHKAGPPGFAATSPRRPCNAEHARLDLKTIFFPWICLVYLKIENPANPNPTLISE